MLEDIFIYVICQKCYNQVVKEVLMMLAESKYKHELILELRQQLHALAEPSMQELKTKAVYRLYCLPEYNMDFAFGVWTTSSAD